MIRLPYGQDVVLDFPLIDAGAEAFESTPVTIAAGDVKVMHDQLIATNPSGKTIAFTSGGTERIKPGQTLTGATSAATCVVIGVRITSGTWAGGDAAGFLFVRSDTGTFQSENLNNTTTGTSNVATIAAALDAAGLFKHLGGGIYAVGIPGSQLSGARGFVKIQDQTATEEWADTAIVFETFGHPDAHDPDGCIASGTLLSTGQGVANVRLGAAPQNAPRKGYVVRITKFGQSPVVAVVKTYTAGATFDIVPYNAVPSGLDDTWSYSVYEDVTAYVSHVAHVAGTVDLASGGTGSQGIGG